MIILEIDNVLTKIIGVLPTNVSQCIKEVCSYSVQGAEFSVYGSQVYCPLCRKQTKEATTQEMFGGSYPTDGDVYRKCFVHGWVKPISLWDGKTYLFDGRSLTFPTGLITRVLSVLKEHNIEYTIQDTRIAPFIKDIAWYGYDPRNYQKKAVNEVLKRTRGVVQAATGTGKSICIAYMIKKTGVNTLVLAHTKSVFNQLYNELKKDLHLPIGRLGDGIVDVKKITVAMPQSLVETVDTFKRKLVKGVWKNVKVKKQQVKEKAKELLMNTEALLVDECFPYTTKVLTERGPVHIGSLVSLRLKTKVWCFNKKTEEFELKPVKGYFTKKAPSSLLDITFSDGTTVRSTKNHKYYVLNTETKSIEQIRADMLSAESKVLCFAGADHTKLYKLLPIKKIEEVSAAVEYVYNIEVSSNHNYLVGDSNVLVSNCHHISASTVQLIANSCPNAYYRVGVSATPWRDDLQDILIEAQTGRTMFKYSASQAIQEGHLAKPVIHMVQFKQDKQPRTIVKQVLNKKTKTYETKEVRMEYADLYEKCVINNELRNKIIERIVRDRYMHGDSVLVIVKRLQHGENLHKLLSDLDADIRYVNGEDDPEYLQQTLNDLDQKKFRVCIATGIFSEGVDIRGLNAVINTTASDSSVNAMQVVGRALRKVPGKDMVHVYDIADFGCRWLGEHSKNRLKIYQTEPEYTIVEE